MTRATPLSAFTRILASIALAIALLTAAAVTARPAGAQPIPRAHLLKTLANRYAEVPTSMGLTSNGAVIEVFTSPDGSTWTFVLTTSDGLSRVIMSGESWTPLPILLGEVS